MLSFLRTFVAVIAAVLFLTMTPLILLLAVALFAQDGPRDDSWLTIRLEGGLLEYYGPATVTDLVEHPPTCLMEIVENLEKAAVDDRIDGVLFRVGAFGAGLGKLDEIRAGIRAVREAGKPVYAHGFDLTDAGLYVASACDSTFLFPDGSVYVLGRGAVLEHYKGTLDLLDVSVNVDAIDEHKTAHELFTREKSSAAALENLRWIVRDLDAAWDERVAEARGLEAERLPDYRARGILRARDAVEAGLVDRLVDWATLADELAGPREGLRIVSSPEYAEVPREAVGLGGRSVVAIVHAQGFVTADGDDRYEGPIGLAMGTDRVIDDLRDAAADRDVKAILLRVDSPGGATPGGQRLARAVAQARNEKPVVVSMADVAASGGYMMSAPANHVVCAASGITGSIGSIVMKFNARGLYEKLGVTFDDLPFAPNAFLWSSLHDWTPEQRAVLEETHRAFYDEWIADIARLRGMEPADVEDAAGGRVWTGRQALERGLVDELGGFEEAMAAARRLADLGEDALSYRHYPQPESITDILLSGDLSRLARNDLVRSVRQVWSGSERAAGPEHLSWEPRRIH